MCRLFSKISIFFAAIFAMLFSTAGFAQTEPRWSVRSLPTDCVIVFNDQGNDTMFSYQLKSSGEHIVGFRPPEWDPVRDSSDQNDDSVVVQFGDVAIAINEGIDPLAGRKITRGQLLEPRDFMLFQDQQSFKLSTNRYEMVISTVGVEGIRAEFGTCLRNLATAGTPPQLKDWYIEDEAFAAVQEVILVRNSKELVVRIDAEGKPTSCRSIPNIADSAVMLRACELLLKGIDYIPATDADGNAIEGELIVFKSD